jgi:hypothetical protein
MIFSILYFMVVPGDNYVYDMRQDYVFCGLGGWGGGFVGDSCTHNFSHHLKSTYADMLWL